MVTEYREYCIICGQPKTDVHHMVFGISKRKLADADGLTMPLCKQHHDLMHKQKEMQVMSHIAGQLLYERNKCAEGYGAETARESFRLRYGKSYL